MPINRDIRFAEYTGGTVNSTTTTLTALLSLSLSPALDTAKAYAVFWSAMTATDASGNLQRVVLDDGATTIYDEVITAARSTSQQWQVGGFAILPAGTTKPTTLRIAGSRPSGTNTSQFKAPMSILVVELGSQDVYNTSDAAQTVASTTLADRCTLTFTPATAGDYLIFGQTRVGSSAASTTQAARSTMDIDAAAAIWDEQHLPAAASLLTPQVNVYKATGLTAASHTARIQGARVSTTVTITHTKTRLLALRLDDFHAIASDVQRARTTTTTTTTLGVTKATAAATEVSAQKYIGFICGTVDAPSTANDIQAAPTRDGVEFPATTGSNSPSRLRAGSATVSLDEATVFLPRAVLSGDGTSHSLDLKYNTLASGTAVGISYVEIHRLQATAPITGTLAATESGTDTAAIAGLAGVIGSVSITEPAPAGAPTKQIVPMNNLSSISNAAGSVRYYPFGIPSVGGTNSTGFRMPMALAGDVNDVVATATNLPTTGSYTVRLRKNGTAVSPAYGFDITSSGISYVGSGPVAIAEGDQVDWALTPVGPPDLIPVVSFACTFTPTVAGKSLLFAGHNNVNTAFFMGIHGANNATESAVSNLVPCAGTITRWRIRKTGTPSSTAGDITYNLRKNGVDTGAAIVCNNAGGQDYLATLNVPFAIDDLASLSFPATADASSTGSWMSFVWEHGTDGEIPVMSGWNTALTNNAERWNRWGVYSANTTTTADAVEFITPIAFTAKNGRAWQNIALGSTAGTFREYRIYRNTTPNTLVTVSAGQSAASDTISVDVLAGEKTSLSVNPSVSPTAGTPIPKFSFVMRTAAPSAAGDSASIVGTVADSSITGTLSATESGSDSAVITGTVQISGTLTVTEVGTDSVTVAGLVKVQGTIAATESATPDTATIVAQIGVSGSVAALEVGVDTVTIAGQVKVQGALAATETGTDTAALGGTIQVAGSLATSETGADSIGIAGQVTISGALTAAETGSDTVVITGTLVSGVAGTLAATESGSDTAAIAASVRVQGSIAAVEAGVDTATIPGVVQIAGTLAATETGADAVLVQGQVIAGIGGSLAATETGVDTVAVVGQVKVQGALAATEVGSDVASIIGQVKVQGTLTVTETGTDTVAIAGTISAPGITGVLSVTEVGADVAAIAGSIRVQGTLVALEVGSDVANVLGGIQVQGTLTAVETGLDVANIVGTIVPLSGSLNATETGTDVVVIAGQIIVAGSITATESGLDAAVIAGIVRTIDEPDELRVRLRGQVTPNSTLRGSVPPFIQLEGQAVPVVSLHGGI